MCARPTRGNIVGVIDVGEDCQHGPNRFSGLEASVRKALRASIAALIRTLL